MRKIALFFIFIVTYTSTQAQSISEFGLAAYNTHYFGDLKDNVSDRGGLPQYLGYLFSSSRYGGGLFYRNNIDERWSLRVSGNWARLQGSDAASEVAARVRRNLSFRNDIIEFSALAEYNLKPQGFDTYSSENVPYVFGGIAIFNMNPKTQYQGAWYELQPLATEGQGLAIYPDKQLYSLTQLAIPIGIGYKFTFNKTFRLGIEVGYRLTYTDYIDDVSGTYADNDIIKVSRGPLSAALADRRQEIQPNLALAAAGTARGSSKYNDAYLFFGITVSKLIWGDSCPAWK